MRLVSQGPATEAQTGDPQTGDASVAIAGSAFSDLMLSAIQFAVKPKF